MIVDSSAVVAVAFREPEAVRIVQTMVGADEVGIAAPTWLEASIVLAASGLREPDVFLADFGREFRVESIAFTAEHARAAREAWLRFGKGRHPARLNLGDCISYAVARVANRPLLYVDGDFAHTDITPALSQR